MNKKVMIILITIIAIVAIILGLYIIIRRDNIGKEENDVRMLRTYGSMSEGYNVKVELSEITKNGIALIITDMNKHPYDYTNHKYKISKKIKNKYYKGEGGHTAGIDSEYIWEEVEAVGSALSVDTEEPYNPESQGDYMVIGRKFDWTNLYGELGERKL